MFEKGNKAMIDNHEESRDVNTDDGSGYKVYTTNDESVYKVYANRINTDGNYEENGMNTDDGDPPYDSDYNYQA